MSGSISGLSPRARRAAGARRRPRRAVTVARSTIPASRSASSGIRSQPPRPITTAAPVAAALLADAAVADVDDPVGDRRRARVVADDERRHALLAGELGEEVVDGRGARLVELARRLVGDQQARPVGERGAERDPLLLAAGELAAAARPARSRRPTRSSRLVRAREALRARGRPGARAAPRSAPPRSARRRARASSAGRRSRACGRGTRARRRAEQRSELERRRRRCCPRSAARTRRAPASASSCPTPLGPSTTQISPSLDVERQPLQRGDAAVGSRVDAEQVAGLDEAHVPASCARAGPRSSRNARRVASATSAAASEQVGDGGRPRRRGGRTTSAAAGSARRGAGGDGDDARDEQREQRAGDRARRARPRSPTTSARTRHDAPEQRRLGALGLEVVEVAPVVAQVGEDREREPERGEEQRHERAAESRARSVPWPSGSSRASSSSAARETASTPRNGGRASAAVDRGDVARGNVEPDLVRSPGAREPAVSTAVCEAADVADHRVARRCRGSGRRPRRPAPEPARRRSRARAVPPSPPASTPSRGVTSTAGGAPSVACRARTRASLCCVIR